MLTAYFSHVLVLAAPMVATTKWYQLVLINIWCNFRYRINKVNASDSKEPQFSANQNIHATNFVSNYATKTNIKIIL